MRRNLKRWVSMLLMAAMLVTMVPVTASAAGESDTFYRIFHLDVGRKYFTVDQVKVIIDKLDTNNYTHLELAIGNDGLRLLLDDMSVSANDTTYSSADVTAGVKAGNAAYSHAGEWSQTEMDEIITYADSKGIEIIPLVNTPGHMDAIVDTMKSVGISNPAYNGSARTVDVTNAEAVAFTQALVGKYIDYFKTKGCEFFHLGCDEYANDKYTSGAMGFGQLQTAGQYDEYITYVNQLAALVKEAEMTPMAFNDGVYFNNVTNQGTFDSDIVITYWTSGWGSYSVASAATLASKGHKIINTNDAWYYVLGRNTGNTYSLTTAKTGVANTKVTDVPGNNDPTPIGCMMCVWCDTPNESYESNAESIDGLISTLSSSNPTYFVASTDGSDEGTGEEGGNTGGNEGTERKENRVITINVGSTVTDVIEGVDVSGSYTTGDTTIATVESAVYKQEEGSSVTELGSAVTMNSNGTYEGVIKYDDNYLVMDDKGNISNTTDIAKATVFTVVRSGESNYNRTYTIYNGTKYLIQSQNTLTSSTSSYGWKWNSSDGFYYTVYGWGSLTYYLGNNNGTWQVSTENSNKGQLYSVTKKETEAIDETTITFKGVTLGTTTVEIGNVIYTINVVDRAPDNAMTASVLTLEYWITNYEVHESASNTSPSSVTINASDALAEEGVDITTLAPAEGYSGFDGWVHVYYWQTVRLDSANQQTTDSNDDEVSDGTPLTHIRYHNNAWQYKGKDGVWKYFNADDQLVAYYLQKKDVTPEIETYFKDWGLEPGNENGSKEQVALTVAVVYPDGTVSPAEGDMYSTSTLIFNYWTKDTSSSGTSGRNLGVVAPKNNSDYDISKITVTDGARTSGLNTSGIWTTGDSITWEKVTNEESGSVWYDETEVWNKNMGTEPMVNGTSDTYMWTAKNTAKLVLIYLEPIHYDTNLIVNWVDDSANGAQISTMEVAVSSDNEETTFYNGLVQTSALPTEGIGGSFILDDAAYIENSSNVKQTFNKDITIIPNVAAQYTSGLYKYVGAELSADGKIMTLHYNIDNSKLALNYIVDFGLSVNVPLSDLVLNPNDVSSVEVTSGSAVVNEDKSITYTPSSVLSGPAAVRVKVNYANSSEPFTIGFTPATTVYYEETFATFENGTENGSAINTTQTKSKDASKDHYGYDVAYADDNAQASNGTYVELGEGGKGEFTFTGTGVDIYANSTPSTGKIMIYLYQGETIKKLYTVDTKMAAGTTGATNEQAVNAFNVPIVTVKGLTSGTYTVKMEVVKTKVTAEDGTTTKVILPVNIDGFRVHGTLPLDSAVYASDLEENPEYYQLRDMVLHVLGVSDVTSGQYGTLKELATQVYDANTGATGIITDESVTYANADTVKDLLDNGPKNEIYLYNGQTLTFKVKTERLMQIGLKALNANTNYTLTLDGVAVQSGDLKTSVDMFYELNNAVNSEKTFIVAVTNNGKGILSVTDLKICDDPNAAFVALSAEDIENILSPEPEVTYADAILNIALNDINGNALAKTALVANGIVGETNIFSAAVIEEAVATLVPEGYELKDATYADQEVAYGEDATVTFTAEEIVEEELETQTSIIGAIASGIKNFFGKLFGWL